MARDWPFFLPARKEGQMSFGDGIPVAEIDRRARNSCAILIVGHGSREARAKEGLEELVAAYAARTRGRRESTTVAHAYVELARPLVDEALATLAASHRRVVVVPLFLFLVGHAKNDIPIALTRTRATFPGVDFVSTRELGVHVELLAIAFDRAAACGPLDAPNAKKTTVVLVGRGSSDPGANAELYRLTRLFSEGRGFASVIPSFIGITTPLVADALETAARSRPDRLIVLPYFLFGGRLVEKLTGQVAEFAARYPWIRTSVAPHLGPDPRLLDIIDERVAEALAGHAALPCDTCQYRAPIAGVVKNVGGERALLWSLRHSWTHGQAAPHRHAHRPLTKHVLVCGNVDCAADGSIPLIEAFRHAVKDAGRQDDIRVTRTSCMGRCGEGPTVAVYPDGIWYRKVRAEDAAEVVREHLLGDRLVARLVDNIMQ
jgi:sirohydrochlorin ferrochelatase/(2Fe-2S) ferredoxin